MNRKLLLTPLLLATMASFVSHAADADGMSRFGSGSRGSGLLGVTPDGSGSLFSTSAAGATPPPASGPA